MIPVDPPRSFVAMTGGRHGPGSRPDFLAKGIFVVVLALLLDSLAVTVVQALDETAAEPSSASSEDALTIRLEPRDGVNATGTEHRITAAVTDPSGEPISGIAVAWELTGVGAVVSKQGGTDSEGWASIVIISGEEGSSTVTGSIVSDDCVSEADEPSPDCWDMVTATWKEPASYDRTIGLAPKALRNRGVARGRVRLAESGPPRCVRRVPVRVQRLAPRHGRWITIRRPRTNTEGIYRTANRITRADGRPRPGRYRAVAPRLTFTASDGTTVTCRRGVSPVRRVLAAPRFRLVDVTEASGIPTNNTRTWGATFVDVDRDGWPDLVVNRHLSLPWFLMNRGGSFERVQHPAIDAPAPGRNVYDRHGCAWGEADGDGRLDLYCVSGAQGGEGTGPNRLVIQTDDGFVDRTEEFRVADQFGRGRTANWLDVDRSGRLDLFVGNHLRRGSPNVLFRHAGDRFVRTRSAVTERRATISSAWADWTGNGFPDLLVTGAGSGSAAYENRRGTLRRVSVPGVSGRAWRSAAFGDFDGDGWPDVALVGRRRLVIMKNQRGTFRRVYRRRLQAGQMALWFDANNNGRLELFVVQGRAEGVNRPNFIVARRGGRFQAVWHASLRGSRLGSGESAAAADFDGDGRTDLFVTNGFGVHRGPVQLLKNMTGGANSVSLVLEGGRRNPAGLGARVRMRTDARTYWREMTDGVVYRSQSEIGRMVLGIGRHDLARLRVVWPRGRVHCTIARAGETVTVRRSDSPCPATS